MIEDTPAFQLVPATISPEGEITRHPNLDELSAYPIKAGASYKIDVDIDGKKHVISVLVTEQV
jgi:hypothetical protein